MSGTLHYEYAYEEDADSVEVSAEVCQQIRDILLPDGAKTYLIGELPRALAFEDQTGAVQLLNFSELRVLTLTKNEAQEEKVTRFQVIRNDPPIAG